MVLKILKRGAISFLEIISMFYVAGGFLLLLGGGFISMFLALYGFVAPLQLMSIVVQGDGNMVLFWTLGILSVAGGTLGIWGAEDIFKNRNVKRGRTIWLFLVMISLFVACWNIIWALSIEKSHDKTFTVFSFISLGWAIAYIVALSILWKESQH